MIKRLVDYIRAKRMSNIAYGRYLGVKIGDNCRIYTKDFGSEPWLIEIGNKVTISAGICFITHDGSTWLFEDEKGRRQLFRRILIGNNVFIGKQVILMPGVKIGNNVIIAAGSVVTKSIPDNCIVGGNPARFLMSFEKYGDRVLKDYVTNNQLDFNLPYRQRIEAVVDTDLKPEISLKK